MDKPETIGVILTNTGTPDSPSVSDVKRYLQTFLSDPKVVRLPRWLWKPLLNLVILPLRSPRSAQLYQNIWGPQGSPLRFIMQSLALKLEKKLTACRVEVGMNYGNPSVKHALEELKAKGITRLIVLPLYPQYSTSTTESSYRIVKQALKEMPAWPVYFCSSYAEEPAYINSLCEQIKLRHPEDHHLLFSFHGLPQKFVDKGDPYAEECQKTVAHIVNNLKLSPSQWSSAYQSRFGYNQWLKPDTFDVLKELPRKGINKVAVFCPGFSVDCLETLEEIQIRAKEIFLEHGGQSFQYIPALNDSDSQVEALTAIINKQVQL
jgi:protoporphyrin/coproporphyrin ferrochelatase